jgi:hypothetical protein
MSSVGHQDEAFSSEVFTRGCHQPPLVLQRPTKFISVLNLIRIFYTRLWKEWFMGPINTRLLVGVWFMRPIICAFLCLFVGGCIKEMQIMTLRKSTQQ